MITITKKSQARRHAVHDTASVDEYLANEKLDLCVAHIKGRCPKAGKMVNSEYSAMCYVIAGAGKICGEPVAEGDAFSIPAGTPYWFEGEFSMTMCGTPAFRPEQNSEVE